MHRTLPHSQLTKSPLEYTTCSRTILTKPFGGGFDGTLSEPGRDRFTDGRGRRHPYKARGNLWRVQESRVSPSRAGLPSGTHSRRESVPRDDSLPACAGLATTTSDINHIILIGSTQHPPRLRCSLPMVLGVVLAFPFSSAPCPCCARRLVLSLSCSRAFCAVLCPVVF